MSYTTIAQLEVDYGVREILQLSDKSNAKVRDDVRLQSRIEDATAMIDGALGRCYVLPLVMADGSALPPRITVLLREWCGRITRFLLTDDARLGGTADQAPHETRARYTEITKLLGGLDPSKKGGCVLLPGVKLLDTTVDAASAAPTVIFGDSGNVWGRSARDSAQFADRDFE